MLLSTAFLPPVEWFALAVRGDLTLEAHEHFIKQTWRSRCQIGTSTGSESILVPVLHGGESLITEVRVDYSTPWVVRAERAIDTAYRSAPFFDHYRDSLYEILETKPETLWELNYSLIEYLLSCLHVSIDIKMTESWTPPSESADDFRYSLTPKQPSGISLPPYYQVFAHKRGFIPGLSAIDLLFGEGPEAAEFLIRRNG